MAGNNSAIPLQPGLAPQAPPLVAQPVPIQGPGVPLTLPVCHQTFASYNSDESRDPLCASYGALLRHFAATGPDTVDPATLQQMAVGNTSIPNAYLCCTS